MARRTRIAKTPDLDNIAAALSRPGIDPRMWMLTGIVEDFAVDDEHGPLADVMLLIPDNITVTARIASWYAGGGFGAYAPLRVDDEVLVAFVGGDLSNGAIVVGRLWSASDLPPDDTYDGDVESMDVLVRAEEGQNIKVVVSGAGDVEIAAEGTGVVNISAGGNVNVTATGATSNVVVSTTGAAGQVMLGSETVLGAAAPLMMGAMQGLAVDTLTGLTQGVLGNTSLKVRIEK
jgi:hypothetical protein